jgi:signal transduction histidine kinase
LTAAIRSGAEPDNPAASIGCGDASRFGAASQILVIFLRGLLHIHLMSSAQPKFQILTRLLQRFVKDTEFNQSIIRLPMGGLSGLYVAAVQTAPQNELGLFSNVSISGLAIYYFSLALMIVAATYFQMGSFSTRRLFSIFHDYSGAGVLMTIGGPASLPVYATIVWVTVGNGIRFGARYLVIAAVASLACLAFLIAINPYLRSNLALSATLVITALIVPGYAFVLLSRLRASAAAAEQANAEKSMFLAQASHDLRQPVHAVGLFVAQLRETPLTAEQATMIGKIDQSIHGAGQLFQSLLDVSTLESGGLKPEAKSVRLNELFADLARQNELSAKWAKANIRFMPTEVAISADPNFLATMLQNLIANAIKYAPGSRILIGCRRRNGRLAIGVYDNGPGIADADLPHITARFFRGKQAAASYVSGMGLGLSIVERLAALLNLSIGIKSTQGRGLAVLIEGFEIVSVQASSLERLNRPYPQQLRDLRIMLIEDDQDTLDATGHLLGKWGCHVSAYTAPPDLIPDIDIVISDFEFSPGDTLANHLPRIAQKKVPIIVVTGTDPVKVKAMLRKPDIVILPKPLRPAELRSLLMAQRANIIGHI